MCKILFWVIELQRAFKCVQNEKFMILPGHFKVSSSEGANEQNEFEDESIAHPNRYLSGSNTCVL